MPQIPPDAALLTHDVTNQPAARGDVDLFTTDPALSDHAGAAGADLVHLAGYGETIGTAQMAEAGRAAKASPEARIRLRSMCEAPEVLFKFKRQNALAGRRAQGCDHGRVWH